MKKYRVTGLVQGIGFRPYVKRLADSLGISGTVKNCGGFVEITASGEPLAEFCMGLAKLPYALIDRITEEDVIDNETDGFHIIGSADGEGEPPVIPADIAVCDSCINEFKDKNNRRYRHPFISCTACGPRYSIIEALPYDRENTVMKDFEMCDSCAAEYTDIGNIRCHAQTVACNGCGPRLKYTLGGDPLDAAVRTIKNGGIVAVKNVGGYHLVCDAENETAAERLRAIKGRETKPFAVMFAAARNVREYAEVSETEERILLSSARPIVLLKKKRDFARSVCGLSEYIGAFLPSDPIQYYLAHKCGAIVMTSANISGEPIITDNKSIDELRRERGGFEILSHDRRILTPLDDSVCRVIRGRMQMIRRARGYVPLPIEIDTARNTAVLAAGGDLKASFCLASEGRAYMSQYFGDLEDAETLRLWKENIARLRDLLGISPEIYVSDMHPLYFSSGYIGGERLQHHFAHFASVMAEHRLSDPALGFVFDGTGYGEDGCVWGGEVISYDTGFRRVGGLLYTELPGGDESAKNSTLISDCFLIAAGLEPRGADGDLIKSVLDNHINTVRSSSMGRLFDAISALLGICGYNTYEGESAIMLEAAAARAKKPYPLTICMRDGRWDTAALIRDIAAAYDRGAEGDELALGFHSAIAEAVAAAARRYGKKTIILSGGVFMNRILTELCFDKLAGFDVYINEQVPTNDGGIALGQAWYALNPCDAAE
ncbi:MAG: carbamoyltransferase HypF [Clostridia bacterium]|nr:carbamoyltransferase HypF [Clostridia bacterium]